MNLDARTEGLPPPPPPDDDQISSLTNPIATPSCCSSRSPSSAGSNFPLHNRRSSQTLALTLTTGSSSRPCSSRIRTPRPVGTPSRPTTPTPRSNVNNNAYRRRRSDPVNPPNPRNSARRSSPRSHESSGVDSLTAAVSELLQRSTPQGCCHACSNLRGNSKAPVSPTSKDLRLATFNPHHQVEPYAKSRKTDPEGYLFTCYLDYNRYIKPSPTVCSESLVRPESLQYSTPCSSACETPRSSTSNSSYLSIPGRRLYSRPPTPVPLARAKEVHRIVMAGVPVDVKELVNCYLFVAEIPGLKNTDVKVQVENDSILKISGERKREECEECEVKYIRVERQAGKFTRKFNLPANADLEHITAACQDGLLSVVVPKSPPIEQRRPKNFDVKIIT